MNYYELTSNLIVKIMQRYVHVFQIILFQLELTL